MATSAIEVRNERGLRYVAAGMFGVASVWPLLPHTPTVCPLRSLTGIPCPLCGMTRAVAALVHGHLATSLAFNPGGVLVVLAAIVAIVRPQVLTRMKIPIWVVAIALGVLWVWNIGFNPTFNQLLWR